MQTTTDAPPLHISTDDIARYITWPLAIDAARVSAAAGTEDGVQIRRTTLPFSGGWMRLMAASIPSAGIFGYKEFHLASDNSVRYCIKVFDIATGRPLGIIDAAMVTTLRTAATAAVAVEHIVGAGAPVRLAVVGSGAEASAGLAALDKVLTLGPVTVTSRSPENRAGFVQKAREQTGLEPVAHADPSAALQAAEVLYVATNSGGRIVVEPADVAHIPVIASIGSTLPEQRELHGGVLTSADRVIVDTHEVFEESGDALEALDLGLDPAKAELLGTALTNDAAPGPDARTVYKSIGSPIQDIILASVMLREADARGFGRRIDPLSVAKVNL